MALLLPDHYYRSVLDVDLDQLRSEGVETLLIDLDNTILPRDTGEMAEELSEWASALLGKGFRVCLVSNNWYAHVKRIADRFGFLIVSKALKPLPFGFMTAIRRLGTSRKRTAIIGDQVFTDVLGGNLLGLTTILVQPLSSSDARHTLLLRRMERMLLAGRKPLP